MYETARSAEDLHLTPISLEEIAQEDAALDRQLAEPLWYPQFKKWARSGLISEEEWRRYQAAYTAAGNAVLPAAGQALE